MNALSIDQSFVETQEDASTIICILCDGSHGNNTMCQMSWPMSGSDV
jgi:hypothetical protein